MQVALIYPSTKRAGFSNLGIIRVYQAVKSKGLTCCVFFLDYKSQDHLIATYDFKRFFNKRVGELRKYPLILFSLSFQNDFLNLVRILSSAGIKLFSQDRRKENEHFVLAGGVALTMNPEPLANFLDAAYIGESEATFLDFLELFVSTPFDKIYDRIIDLEGFYLPSHYKFIYSKEGLLEDIKNLNGSPEKVRRVYPEKLSSPVWQDTQEDSTFKNMRIIEIGRGCSQRCRFCVASYLFLPPRHYPKSDIFPLLQKDKNIESVGLVSPMTSDHPEFSSIISEISLKYRVSPSSLKMWSVDSDTVKCIVSSGAKTITIAPEAGTERMRRLVNKPIKDSDVIEVARMFRETGVRNLKLYFMIGLPTEESYDIEGISELSKTFKNELKGDLTVTVSPFVPKPWTPFQWCSQDREDSLQVKMSYLKKSLSKTGIKVSADSVRAATLESLLSLSGRDCTEFILESARSSNIRSLLIKYSFLLERWVWRQKNFDEIFPWDVIDTGVTKKYLLYEMKRGLASKLSKPCDVGVCKACGVC